MLKLLIFLVGLASGAVGAVAWMLGLPSSLPAGANATLADARRQLDSALAEGERAGGAAEARMRQELTAYRQGRAPTS